jgi:hypothetical protein
MERSPIGSRFRVVGIDRSDQQQEEGHMFKASRRLLSLVAMVVGVGGLAAASAQADVAQVNGERTAITLNATSLGFFSEFGITATPTGPATSPAEGSFILPITHGWVTTSGPPKAKIDHSGGTTFATQDRMLKFRDFVLVRGDDQITLKALLNDRGWVTFASVSPFTITYATSTEAILNGELKISEQTADAFDWLVGSPGAVPVGIDIGKLKSTVRVVG